MISILKAVMLFPICLIIVLTSCAHVGTDTLKKENRNIAQEWCFSINTTYPKHYNRTDTVLKITTKRLGLENIRNGYPGKYVRIWYWEPNNIWVANIKDTLSNSIDVYSYKESINQPYPDSTKYEKILYVKNAKPPSGWDSLNQVIKMNQIWDLADESKLPKPNSSLISGGYTINVELAQDNFYRNYTYTNPDFYENGSLDRKMILQFIDFFIAQFSLKPIKRWQKE